MRRRLGTARSWRAAPWRALLRLRRRGWWITCPECDLTSEVFPRAGEAVTLAGTHDGLRHRGVPTAVVESTSGVPAGVGAGSPRTTGTSAGSEAER